MIHIFIGTKAQLIKMAPIMVELDKRNIEYNFVFSGQHQDTTAQIRENFGIKNPDTNLYNGPDVTSIPKAAIWFIKCIWATIRNRKAIWKDDPKGIVLNHGDTFSTLLGSILARIAGLKSAHIESGLRSFKVLSPFPEELTRIIVFHLSTHYFAPGDWALSNLKKYSGEKINTQENTILDALNHVLENANNIEVDVPSYKYAIVSFHRFENIFNKSTLEHICELLISASKKIPLLIIMHKPTKEQLIKKGLIEKLENQENIELRPRYDYFKFIKLIRHCEFVMTDGGSNQEECYHLGKPTLLLRNYTERQEGLNETSVISNFKAEVISDFIDSYHKLTTLEDRANKPSPSRIIVDSLEEFK